MRLASMILSVEDRGRNVMDYRVDFAIKVPKGTPQTELKERIPAGSGQLSIEGAAWAYEGLNGASVY